jgi:hypothetical protein
MAITRLNSLAIPAGTIVESDLSYPLTNFSSTGIDDNATSTAVTINSSQNVGVGTASPGRLLDVEGIIRSNGTSSAFALGGNSSTPTEGAAIHRPANGTIAFVNESSESMRIDSSGTVIINQSAGSSDNTIVRLMGGTAGYSTLQFADSDDLNIGMLQYNHSTNALAFNVNDSERMRIGSSGSVGIGTSSPNTNAKFEVVSTSAGAVTNVIQLRNGDATAGSGAKLQFLNSTVNYATAGTSEITGVRYSGNYSALTFTTYGPTSLVERMRIDGVGNVGIGTASPQSYTGYKTLHVAGPTTTGSGLLYLTNSDSSLVGMAFAEGSQSRITFGSQTNHPVTFLTNDTERMRIDTSGRLMIGKTAVSNSSDGYFFEAASGGYASFVNSATASSNRNILCNRHGGNGDTIQFRRANVQVGSISVTTSATSYNTTSDQRLKENIVDAPAGNIDAIRVRSFDWKADGTHQTYGMVAQELVDVAPEAVAQGDTDDDMWSVDYSKLVPMMIKEIQDLKAEVAALKGA